MRVLFSDPFVAIDDRFVWKTIAVSSAKLVPRFYSWITQKKCPFLRNEKNKDRNCNGDILPIAKIDVGTFTK